MASQAVDNQAYYEMNSFIRGLHVYQDMQTPVTSEVLLLNRQQENTHDKYAVAVIR